MLLAPPAAAGEAWPGRPLPLCGDARRIDCIVDGDTLWLDGRKVRLEDIDAPEIEHFRCAGERALGLRAQAELQRLASGQALELVHNEARQVDRYGRELATLEVAGRSLGLVLVEEGLAHRWDGRKHPWC